MAEMTSRAAAAPAATRAGRLPAWLIALASGAVGVAALPPFDVFQASWPWLIGLMVVLEGRRPAAAFRLGWLWALGFFTPGLYWISNALFVDIGRFWWMLPFALLGLPALLAVFFGAASALYAWARPSGWMRPILLAACLTLADFARGHLLTGFPWNPIGSVWSDHDAPRQIAAFVGVYGLGFLTVAIASSPGLLLLDRNRRAALHAALAFTLVGVAWIGFGAWRLAGMPTGTVEGVRLRLVQPNISETDKWHQDLRLANFQKHLRLSQGAPVSAVIWSESATAFVLEREPEARRLIAQALPDTLLITGTPRLVDQPDGTRKLYNGLVALGPDDRVVGSFDKAHLVPFGEYVPLRGILPIDRFVPGGMDFSPGPGPRTLDLPGLPPVGPLICYEVIFPHAVVDEANRPAWLLNLTNDAWYGYSIGPFQHFATARMRATEEGLPLVRVANIGISGVIDAAGRVTATKPLQVEGILDADLPIAVPQPLYARFGNFPLLMVVAACIVFATGGKKSRRNGNF